MKKFNWDGKLIQIIEILLDIFFVVAAFILSVWIATQEGFIALFTSDTIRKDIIITSCILAFGVIVLFRIYRISITKRNYFSTMVRIGISLFVLTFVIFVLTFTPIYYELSKSILVMMFIIQILFLGIVKGASYAFLKRVHVQTSLIFGPKEEVESLAKKILYDDNRFIHLKYLVFEDAEFVEYDELFAYIGAVDYVYLTESLSSEKKNIIISHCFKIQKKFYLVPKLYELSINKARVTQAGDTLLYEIKGLGLTIEQRFIKRTFDLVVSLFAFIIASPFMLIVALIIKLYDRGPVLLKQERITRNNKKFILYKFRTMVPNAEEISGPVFAAEKDPRITKVGKFLRATRIDELPQLINIIKGEMSIVGPRPERDFFIQQFTEENREYSYRLNVKAGVTGLAQALGTYNTEFNEKLRFDIYYITNYSFLNDMVILLHTLRSVIDPKSAKGLADAKDLKTCLEEEGYILLHQEDSHIKIVVDK